MYSNNKINKKENITSISETSYKKKLVKDYGEEAAQLYMQLGKTLGIPYPLFSNGSPILTASMGIASTFAATTIANVCLPYAFSFVISTFNASATGFIITDNATTYSNTNLGVVATSITIPGKSIMWINTGFVESYYTSSGAGFTQISTGSNPLGANTGQTNPLLQNGFNFTEITNGDIRVNPILNGKLNLGYNLYLIPNNFFNGSKRTIHVLFFNVPITQTLTTIPIGNIDPKNVASL
jgi:hypothetical protein